MLLLPAPKPVLLLPAPDPDQIFKLVGPCQEFIARQREFYEFLHKQIAEIFGVV